MTLFNTAPTTPNDREWIQIRDSLQNQMRSTMGEISRLSAQIRHCVLRDNLPSLKRRMDAANDRLLILQDDFQKHVALRTKYEAAGRQQLSLF